MMGLAAHVGLAAWRSWQRMAELQRMAGLVVCDGVGGVRWGWRRMTLVEGVWYHLARNANTAAQKRTGSWPNMKCMALGIISTRASGMCAASARSVIGK